MAMTMQRARGFGKVGKRLRDERGQMTVELMAMIPAIVAVAVIAINALLFFSECAAFDRAVRNGVRVHATSPAYGQGPEQCAAGVESFVEEAIRVADKPYLSVRVEATGRASGQVEYRATLRFSPTLFGLGFKSSVFGVALPGLEHSASLVVEPYKPGVLF